MPQPKPENDRETIFDELFPAPADMTRTGASHNQFRGNKQPIHRQG
jgi:hypothetical protein